MVAATGSRRAVAAASCSHAVACFLSPNGGWRGDASRHRRLICALAIAWLPPQAPSLVAVLPRPCRRLLLSPGWRRRETRGGGFAQASHVASVVAARLVLSTVACRSAVFSPLVCNGERGRSRNKKLGRGLGIGRPISVKSSDGVSPYNKKLL